MGGDHENDRFSAATPGRDEPSGLPSDLADAQFAGATDERRMHVRAYNHWVSLLRGRDYPAIRDLDPARIADFGPNGVLLDFTQTAENPAITYLGHALREECCLDGTTTHIAQVPRGSLLSRLTDHYRQIIADRAPIGFEAEFVSTRGHNTLYRGILMPFSSDAVTIDYMYGVINWKELVDADTEARLYAEIAAVRRTPLRSATAPVWADGPSHDIATLLTRNEAAAGNGETPGDNGTEKASSLIERLAVARQTAVDLAAADADRNAALQRALARALDFATAADADPHGYETLLDEAKISVPLRGPMTPVVDLVFGADLGATRRAQYVEILTIARSRGVSADGLPAVIESREGGSGATTAGTPFTA